MSTRLLAAVPQFTAPDLVRTTEHYRDVLGFEITGYWDGERMTPTPERRPYFAIVRRDDVAVFFNQADAPGKVHTGRSAVAYDAFLRVLAFAEAIEPTNGR